MLLFHLDWSLADRTARCGTKPSKRSHRIKCNIPPFTDGDTLHSPTKIRKIRGGMISGGSSCWFCFCPQRCSLQM